MRTSTVAVLVLSLCYLSSSDRRHDFREFVGNVKQGVREVVAELRGYELAPDHSPRGLKQQLRELDARTDKAAKTLRAVDRSIRQLRDRLDDAREDARRSCNSRVAIDSIEMLARQIDDLETERRRIVELQIALKNERVTVQSALDLESVRDERRELEELLNRNSPPAPGPLDRLAAEQAPTYVVR